MNIYVLKSDVTNYCSFIEEYSDGDKSIMSLSRSYLWKSMAAQYEPISLSLRKNDFGQKNYKFDISSSLSPFFIISERTFIALEDILYSRGDILPVLTESKKKVFFGFYPTNAISGCFDRSESIYTQYPKGNLIRKCILKKDKITEEYLFTIAEDVSTVFVTEKFKQRVFEAGLQSFDFSHRIGLS